jgi:CRP/FNR family transcriptional regulator, cyclic AMP receptor protein
VGAVSILDADPDLADGLPESEREEAVRHLVAPAFELPAGPWAPGELGRQCGDAFGLLVLNGVVSRTLTLAGRTTGELLGSGDVLRPWEGDEAMPPVPCEVHWMVHSPMRLALLDRRFVATATRWPTVIAALAHRTVRRSHALSLQLALGQVPRVEGRLLLLFWRLAERWGRMTPDGIVVPLKLTHETLGALVAARRPSVTSALGRLADAGLLRRGEGGGWLLARGAEARLGEFLVAQESPEAVKPPAGRARAASPAR